MEATFLTAKPISGTFPEVGWASASRPNVWIRFDTPEPWVGVFAIGWSHYSAIHPFGSGETPILVIAGGQGYVLDVVGRTLLRKTPWNGALTAATVPATGSVVVANSWSIWLERPGGLLPTTRGPGWVPDHLHPDDLALDGLVLDSVSTERVSGRAYWHAGWHRFVLNVKTRVFTLEQEIVEAPYEGCYPAHFAAMREYFLF